MSDPLERELNAYNENLPALLAHTGKYVVIKGDDVVDFFDTYADATKFGYQRFGLDPFLVKRISPAEHVSFFTRDFAQPCHV